jgi:hypothetical protein
MPEPLPDAGENDSDESAVSTSDGDQEPFDVKSLPDIDSLGPSSDFSVFMQAGVPSELKTKALRKLWRVKSELANLDGLIDYGEDLTGSFKVASHLKTAYEVGRGFLRDDQGVPASSTDRQPKDEAVATNDAHTEETVATDGQSETSDPIDGEDDAASAGEIDSGDDKPARA